MTDGSPIDARRNGRRWRSTRVGAIALLAGVGHLLVVHRLTLTLEHRPLFPTGSRLLDVDPAGAVLLAVVSLGLILLAAVAVILAWRGRLLSPLAFVLLALGWATYRTWLLSLETLPPAGPGFGVSPTPLTLYAWGSFGLLVVAGLLGATELWLRRAMAGAPEGE